MDGSGLATSASTTTKVNALVLLTTNTTTNNAAYTTDGINYTLVTAGSNTGGNLTGYGGVVCSTGNVYSNYAFSNDAGKTWTLVNGTMGQNLSNIIYFNGKYYTGGYNYNTGILYTTTPSVASSWTSSISISNFMVNTLFACTLNGTPTLFASNDMYNVYNGQNYNGITSSGPNPLYYSTNGTTFTQCTNPGSAFYRIGASNNSHQTFATNGTKIVAIGSTASGSTLINTAAYSTNGSTWTTCTFSQTMASGIPWSVAYGGGLWMISFLNNGSYIVLSSTDGSNFNTTVTVPINVQNLGYISGTWVAVSGGNDSVYYSTNGGSSWTASSTTIRNVNGAALAFY